MPFTGRRKRNDILLWNLIWRQLQNRGSAKRFYQHQLNKVDQSCHNFIIIPYSGEDGAILCNKLGQQPGAASRTETMQQHFIS